MNERQKTSSRLLGETLLNTMRAEVINPENFKIAKEHLKQDSILLYFNHFAKLDSILYGKVIRDHLTSLDHAIAIASRRHFDPDRGKPGKIQNYIGGGWEKAYGLTILQVVQKKDEPDYADFNEFNRRSVMQIIRLLKRPGNVIAIAPEGTRSKTGELLKAEEGLGSLFRLGGENVLALPLAAEHSSVVPLATKTRVIAGKPFSYEEIEEEHKQNPDSTITELMMRHLADLLPPKNRGFYS